MVRDVAGFLNFFLVIIKMSMSVCSVRTFDDIDYFWGGDFGVAAPLDHEPPLNKDVFDSDFEEEEDAEDPGRLSVLSSVPLRSYFLDMMFNDFPLGYCLYAVSVTVLDFGSVCDYFSSVYHWTRPRTRSRPIFSMVNNGRSRSFRDLAHVLSGIHEYYKRQVKRWHPRRAETRGGLNVRVVPSRIQVSSLDNFGMLRMTKKCEEYATMLAYHTCVTGADLGVQSHVPRGGDDEGCVFSTSLPDRAKDGSSDVIFLCYVLNDAATADYFTNPVVGNLTLRDYHSLADRRVLCRLQHDVYKQSMESRSRLEAKNFLNVTSPRVSLLDKTKYMNNHLDTCGDPLGFLDRVWESGRVFHPT